MKQYLLSRLFSLFIEIMFLPFSLKTLHHTAQSLKKIPLKGLINSIVKIVCHEMKKNTHFYLFLHGVCI